MKSFVDHLCENKRESDRVLDLEMENTRLQYLVAELLIKNQMLRERLHRAMYQLESIGIFGFDFPDYRDR